MARPEIWDLDWAAFSGPSATLSLLSRPRAGDLLICIHSADRGSTSQMSVSGGQGGWQTVATAPGFTDAWAGTKISRRVAAANEPASYTVSQDADADGVAAILLIRNGSPTGITVRNDGADAFTTKITCPGATPPSAGCLDLRWAAATIYQPGGFISFSPPPGFEWFFADQSGLYCAASLAARELLTSSPVPAVTFDVSPVDVWQGVTILIPPGQAGGEPPPPTHFPVGTLGRGAGMWRYAVHDLRTGAYIDDIYPAQVQMDRRIGEPGAFSATIPIPNSGEGRKLRAIFGATPAENIATGPGRSVIHVWRGDHLWDIYWVTGARYSQSGRGKPQLEVRGATLDAYFAHVPIRQDLFLTGDQAAVARSLITYMQSLPDANIGLTLQSGNAGASIDLDIKGLDRVSVGDALRAVSEAENSIEWMIDPVVQDGQIIRRWVWGRPLGGDQTHIVQQGLHGGDVVDWSIDIDPLRGVTYLDVRGGVPEIEDVEEETPPRMSQVVTAAAHLSAGWPRIDRTIDHPAQSLRTSVLNAYARYWMSRLAGSVFIRTVRIALAADSTITPSRLGDNVRILMSNELFPTRNGQAGLDETARLIGLGVTPNGRGNGKDIAELIFEQVEDI